METCSKFTAAEGGARLAMAAAARNTLAVEYSAFVATRLLHEDAYRIRGLLSAGFQRSAYVTRAAKVELVAYELHILTDLTAVKALEYSDVEDWGAELEEKQVIVCTSQVLKHLLEEGKLSIPLLNVLIIDSCHMIFEDQSLQYIMKCYKESKESEQPRILALTYPLFTSGRDSEQDDNNCNDKVSDTIAASNEPSDNCKVTETDLKFKIDKNKEKDKREENTQDASEKNDKLVELKLAQTEFSDGIEEKRIIEITDDKENELSNKEKQEQNEKVIDKTSIDAKYNESTNKTKLEDESEKKEEIADSIVKCEAKDMEIESKVDLKSTDISKDTVKLTEDKDTTTKDKESIKDADNITEDNINTTEDKDTATKDKEEDNKDKSNDLKESHDDFDMYEMLEWKIEQLEEALCCKMDLAEDIDGGKRLVNTVAKPKEILIEYSTKSPLDSKPDAYLELESFMKETVVSAKAFMDEHRYDPTEIYGDDLYEEFKDIPDPTIEPKLMFDQFLYVLDQLGPYAADKAAFSLLVKLEKLKIKVPYERHFLLLCLCTSVFVKIRCHAELILSKYDDWDRIHLFSTPKVLRFAEILEQFQSPEQREKTDSLNNHREIDYDGKIREVSEISKDIAEIETQEERSEKDVLRRNCNTEVEGNCKRTNSKDSNDENITECNESRTNREGIKQNNPKDDTDDLKTNENNVDNKSKLVRSKTTELIDELEKCDFVTLGNKLEDRVNTYEANLKELDDVDNDNLNEKTNDKKCVCVNESTTIKYDSIDNDKSDITNDNADLKGIDKATKKDNTNDESISKLSKIKTDELNIKATEQKFDPPDPSLKKGLGFRKQRVRGRRVQRTHAARMQQLQQNPDALCGIVFVKEPLVAKIMFMIIVDMSRCRPSLSHLCAQYCAVESEGDDCRPRGKKHEDVLKKFRMHECNLLLATSALEEGIELPRCNLVVRWDAPQSYRSHGLCRSRARASRSAVALLGEAPSEGLLDNLSVYKELDQMISRKCGCGIQNEPPPSEEVYADVFTPIVKAYTPDETKDNKVIDSKKDASDSKDQAGNINGVITDRISKDEKEINEQVCGIDVNNDADNTKGDMCNDNDKVNDVHKEINENVMLNNDEPAKDAMKTNGDFKSEINEALINKINVNNEINDKNIPINSNETRDSLKETNFNIKYSFKNCECKSDLCKCKTSKSEVKSKLKMDDEFCSVDLSTAIALINRYCGKLPSDTFTRLAPQYWTEVVHLPDRLTGELRQAYVCTLRLPLNCPVKYNIVGHPMPSAVLARRMVALQACRILHKSGELDDQLMPIGKENFKAAELETVGQSDSDNNDSARPGTTKRRQYYYKRTAAAFTDCQPIIDSTDADIEEHSWKEVKDSYKKRFGPDTAHNTLYALTSRLWCALPERYNTRGRRLHAPQHAQHAVAVLMAARDERGLHIPAFPVYTRSGEVRVAIERAPHADVRLSPGRARLVRRFMRFVFSDVLRVRRRGMRLQAEGSTHNNYYIVPTVRVTADDGTSYVDIDWSFLELIYQHTEEKKNAVEKPVLLHQDDEEEEEVVEKKPKREKEKDGKVKKMENPLLAPGEVFVFDADKYRDAVVTPWYRNRDQPQYFLVAEICWNLTPDSAFPSTSHGSFREYYAEKYGVTLTQPNQPLLDVDHTSARLNLLTPRYVNRKGVALPVSSERTRRAKRDRLDQKQILVPELCAVHPFAAPLWFATVALPCVLYRINALLIADEIRRSVGADVALGAPAAPGAPPPQWPPLDFGWSLAEVLNSDEKSEKSERKKEDEDCKREKENKEKEDKDTKEDKEGEEKNVEVREKTINDILQEKEDAESGFEIGTWSNDMASSIPAEEYDEYLEPLPPNLTFCTSASGGANWSEPIEKPKMTFGASKTFSVAESDCSYMSSDFDTDGSDLNSEGTDEETDSSGFFSKNSYAAMGVRIEYKTAHEAEAVDVERQARVSSAPQVDQQDRRRDLQSLRRVLRMGSAPHEYIEKYRKSVAKHKEIIRTNNVIIKDKPIKDILPDTSKELERLRKDIQVKLENKKLLLKNVTDSLSVKTDNEKAINEAIVNAEAKNAKPDSLKEANNDKDAAINEVIATNAVKDEINEVKVKSKVNNDTEINNAGLNNHCNEVKLKCTDSEGICYDVTKKLIKLQKDARKSKENNRLVNKVLSKEIKDLNIIRNIHKESDKNAVSNTDDNKDLIIKELLSEMLPYGDRLEFENGQVTLESIERNKRVLLENFKKTLSEQELKKMNCFSMLDIDIDSPNYVNDKVVNVGFDTKENYYDKVNGFRNPKEYTPYYQDGKGQNGKEFDFDFQPDLESHPGPSPSVILQALTMSNANDGINLERLETIGDSFLKFAITAYLYCAHPAVHEGKLSHMRSKQVSNLNLYRLGRNKRLGARMIASKFEPHDNWLPPCHRPPPTHHPATSEQEMQMHKEAALDNAGCFIPYNLITQHSIPDKSIADCVEALIGAYLLEMGPRGALLFMSWLGISVLPRHVLPLPPDHPWLGSERLDHRKPPPPPSPKQSYASSSPCTSDSEDQSDDEQGPEDAEGGGDCDWSWPGRPVGSLRPWRDEQGNWYQTVYGELRAPPSPLLRYVEDPEGELERMLSGYEALERTLQYRFKDRSLLLQALTHASHHQNRLTDCYQRLEFLGDAILDYLITRHLYEDARRHSPGALTDLRSALVNNTIFATLAARHGFHKYFRHMSPGLNEVLTKYVKIQEENGHSISEEHYLIQEDEMEQAEDVEVPKALGDLFESVAGAIFLDSGMSLGAVWASYGRLMGAELDAFSAIAPKSPVRELLEAEPDTAKFGKPERLADGRRVRVCVEVFGRGAFKGIGRNYRIAKGTAARCALRHLRGARPRH